MTSRITHSYYNSGERYAEAVAQRTEELGEGKTEQVEELHEAVDQDHKAEFDRLHTGGPTHSAPLGNMPQLEVLDIQRRNQLLRENPGAFTRRQQVQPVSVLIPQARPVRPHSLGQTQTSTLAPAPRAETRTAQTSLRVGASRTRQTTPSGEKKT